MKLSWIAALAFVGSAIAVPAPAGPNTQVSRTSCLDSAPWYSVQVD